MLAVAAPPELLTWTQKASAEEIVHAQMSFAVASYYRTGEESRISPGAFPTHQLRIGNDRLSLVNRLIVEGLINETVSAVELAIRHDACASLKIPLLETVFKVSKI